MTQFADHVNMRYILYLISGIPRILQKCFNDTAIFTSLALPAAGVHPVILSLNLNDSESVVLLFESSL